jgi:hypothetical protein
MHLASLEETVVEFTQLCGARGFTVQRVAGRCDSTEWMLQLERKDRVFLLHLLWCRTRGDDLPHIPDIQAFGAVQWLKSYQEVNPGVELGLVLATNGTLQDPWWHVLKGTIWVEAVCDGANLFRRLQELLPRDFGMAPEYFEIA